MHRFVWTSIFLIFITSVFAQDVQDDGKLKESGVKIAKDYKDKVVVVRTIMYMEGGSVMEAGGSGVFIDKEGHIATVAHVVKEKDDLVVMPGLFGSTQTYKIIKYEYYVTLASKKRKYKATLVGHNLNRDIALLKAEKIDPADYGAAPIGNPDNLKVGEPLFAIGTPYGFRNTFTHGTVSALNRFVDFWYVEDFIQTDCPINPGNSGCPIINSQGEVVALADLGIRAADGMAWGVSMKLYKLDRLKAGEMKMPWFGAEALIENFDRMGKENEPTIEDLIALYNFTGLSDLAALETLARLTYPTFRENEGWAVVTMVEETQIAGKYSPAKRVGLQRGDLITSINGKAIKSGMDLRMAVDQAKSGDVLELGIIRVEKNVAKSLTLKVQLEDKPNTK